MYNDYLGIFFLSFMYIIGLIYSEVCIIGFKFFRKEDFFEGFNISDFFDI